MQNQKLKDFIRMQKVFFTIAMMLVSSLVWPVMQAEAYDGGGCGSGNYVISAYYSPVPGQARYATGTYDGDIRLNGGGVTTASGVKVADSAHPFVAAPPCMPFGTVLEIDGLGSHTVLDRGGAIKGNRLDIWMGYGDVGLQNALSWGKRTVLVIVDGDTNVDFSHFERRNDDNIALYNGLVLGKESLKDYQIPTVQDPLDFLRGLAFGDSGEDVARLQQLLKDLNFYRSSVTGKYDELTKNAVTEFQQAHGLLNSNEVSRSGRFGSSTIAKLKSVVITNREKMMSLPSRNLGRGSTGEDVLKLQYFLMSLGLLDSATGVYDSSTVSAVMAFQLSQSVIGNVNEQGAGYFGPATQIAVDRVANSVMGEGSMVVLASAPASTGVVTEVADRLNSSLEEGMEGREVVKLQMILKDLGYLKIDANGYFGPVTKNAVMAFQSKLGLLEEYNGVEAGYVGVRTREALNGYLAKKESFLSELKPYGSESEVSLANVEPEFQITARLKVGASHPEVKLLQQFLKSRGYFTGDVLTDYFGPITKNAVLKFKEDYNLFTSGDDIFDEATRVKLNGLI